MNCKLCGKEIDQANNEYCVICASLMVMGKRAQRDIDSARSINGNNDSKIEMALQCYQAMSEKGKLLLAIKCASLKGIMDQEAKSRRGRQSNFGHISALSLICSMMRAGYL